MGGGGADLWGDLGNVGDTGHVGEEVLVGQEDTLGIPSSTRGVHDGLDLLSGGGIRGHRLVLALLLNRLKG